MGVEVKLPGGSRELNEGERDYDPGDSTDESDTGDDEKEENESVKYSSEEEDEEEYCLGGYHRIGSDDLLIDRCILQTSFVEPSL